MRWWVLVTLVGCKVSDEAPDTLNDPMITSFDSIRAGDDALAPALRALEEQIYRNVQVDAKDTVARSIAPGPLSAEDVADLQDHPDGDPADCLAIAVAWPSPFEIDRHAALPLLEDQRPLEPSSPDFFDRQFLGGQDCWEGRGCVWLNTFQDLTKEYGIVPPITYQFFKDFRWIDLNAGTGEPERWAYVAQSWNPGVYRSEKGDNALLQSYTLELWLPRDGGGFRWDGDPPEKDQGDSSGGGTLRFLTLWSENEMALTDDEETIIGTIRWGMDRNFKAHDAWLEEHP
ncbi:MAG TPA: hypothetical protein PKA64_10945 [Myxococcota bacterium]|nr:hypothetical protein [Myxococcota bacterium]